MSWVRTLPRRCARHALRDGAVLLVLCIAGCGGGGAPSAPPIAVPVPPPVAPPAALAYLSPVIVLSNAPMTPLRPAVTGLVDSFTVVPPLPAGLSLDARTGLISGTPTGISDAAHYVVTAANSGGSKSATLLMSVEHNRTTLDQPDLATSPYQVHAVYAVPADGADRRMDVDGTIERSLLSMVAWFKASSSGAQHPRLDQRLDGSIDVTFYRLRENDSHYSSRGSQAVSVMGTEILGSPLYDPRKVFLIYYEGGNNASCGSGQYPGHFSALYVHGTPPVGLPCDTRPFASSPTAPAGYHEWGAAHEIVHNLGFVQDCAPDHRADSGHHTTSDPTDLMWAASPGSPPQPWRPTRVDPGDDDYYGANVRATCTLNLFFSAFLEPTHGTQRPAGF